jgi:hypothetical protein
LSVKEINIMIVFKSSIAKILIIMLFLKIILIKVFKDLILKFMSTFIIIPNTLGHQLPF